MTKGLSSRASALKAFTRGCAGRPSERSAFSSLTFTVPMAPVGKGRPRFGNGRTYTPAKTVSAEAAVAVHAKVAMRGRSPLDGPVSLTVRAFFGIPKSWTKKMRALAEGKLIFPTAKIDADNILKLIGDALNGIVYIDDRQVVAACVFKDFCTRPRIEVDVAAVYSPWNTSNEVEATPA